ncbi:MAG: oligosaccharide flippase family protein [Chloroflexi bacterium]|nr:oligosaccharide flippase family protein [Chloroflexota bacterium]
MGYAVLLDAGMRSPLIKYVAEYHARGDGDGVNRIVSTSLAYFCVVAIIASAGLGVAGPWVLDHFVKLALPRWQLILAYYLYLANFAINLVLGVFIAVIRGLQRFDLDAKINLAGRSIGIFGSIAVLYLGWGLVGLTIQTFVLTLGYGLCYVILTFRSCPGLYIAPRFATMGTFRKLMSFSLRIQVGRISTLINTDLGQLLLAYFLGPTQVGYYTIATNITERARSVPMSVVSTITPAASQFSAVADDERFRALLDRSLRYICVVGVPLFAGVVAFSHPFLNTWLGPGYVKSAVTADIIATSYVFLLLTGPVSSVLIGSGFPGIWTTSTVIRTATVCTLAPLLIHFVGYYGAPVALAASYVASESYMLVMGIRKLGGWVTRSITSALVPPILGTLPAVGLGWVILLFYPGTGWPRLICAGITYMTSYALLWLVALADTYDRALARSLLTQRFRQSPVAPDGVGLQ